MTGLRREMDRVNQRKDQLEMAKYMQKLMLKKQMENAFREI